MGWETWYGRERVAEAVASSICAADALRKLDLRAAGGNFKTLKRWTAAWDISTEHFDPHAKSRSGRHWRGQRAPLADLLVAGSTASRHALKKRLFEAGLKQRACEHCGQGEEWRGRPMTLILDHINGTSNDNRLENLQIVCPNCAATLDTHCGRNAPARRTCPTCSSQFAPQDRRTRYCSRACFHAAPSPHTGKPQVHLRRVERPSEEQLLAEIAEHGTERVGGMYGVSGTAIRKWRDFYARERERGADTPD